MPVVTRSMAKRARPEAQDDDQDQTSEPPVKKQKVSERKPREHKTAKKKASVQKTSAKKQTASKKKKPAAAASKKKAAPKKAAKRTAATKAAKKDKTQNNEADVAEEEEKSEELGVGVIAPDFNDVLNEKGETVSLKDYRGRFVALYFYPRDNTPGCTKEGQCFRDLCDEFKALNCSILGVSADKVESHQKFVEKQKFNFSLLADTNREVIQKYGALKAGNKIRRSTVLIDPNGKIVRMWSTVRGAAQHPHQVLAALKEEAGEKSVSVE